MKLSTITLVLASVILASQLALCQQQQATDYTGFTDSTTCKSIAGWLADRKQPGKPITVKLTIMPENLTVLSLADLPSNEGVKQALQGDASGHNFNITPLPDYAQDGKEHSFTLNVDNFVLPRGVFKLTCPALTAPPVVTPPVVVPPVVAPPSPLPSPSGEIPVWMTYSLTPRTGILLAGPVDGRVEIWVDATVVPVRVAAPEKNNTACTQGAWSADNTWWYICIAKDTWRRSRLESW